MGSIWGKLRLKRRIEQDLSSGQGVQFMWLIGALCAIGTLFYLIGSLFFDESPSEIISMFLDPGSFKPEDGFHHNFLWACFRLLTTLIGLLFTSALLISIFSNMFENISSSFKRGESKYNHSSHVLILGAGHQLFGIIKALIVQEKEHKDIVVVSDSDIESLRGDILGMFTEEDKNKVRKRVTFYHGKRENESILTDVHAELADSIYIIGEDNESSHDQTNISCCETLKRICEKSQKDINCYLVLNNRSSIDVFKYAANYSTEQLKIDVIDENIYMAESVLIADHDGKDIVDYPKIDYRGIKKIEGQERWEQEVGIYADTHKYVHFVVAGMTETAKAMAITAALSCHFPNYKIGYRTRITFICKDIEKAMNEFVSRYDNLFSMSHWRYITFDSNSKEVVKAFEPEKRFGDFLDIEWEFVDGELTDRNIRHLLSKWAVDPEQSFSLCISLPSDEENIDTAISLPSEMYELNNLIPIFVHQREEKQVVSNARATGQYGQIYAFGMKSGVQDDPLYENRRGKNVNYLYSMKHRNRSKPIPEKEASWKIKKEADKMSSAYGADGVYCRCHSFNIDLENPDLSHISEEILIQMMETDHRRWMMAVLFLGYYPLEINVRKEITNRMNSNDKLVSQSGFNDKNDYKAKFYHLDLAPWEETPISDQNNDRLMALNIPYVLGKSTKLLEID
ncbi:MAG: hypothetical protein MJZ16_02205 [Bacteroidales bacterium]|nr:hypothetical protein [Bacteroidales bacterium]